MPLDGPNANPVASNVETIPAPGTSGPMLPEFAAGAPEQSPLRNQSTFTFPVGAAWPACPVTVTRS